MAELTASAAPAAGTGAPATVGAVASVAAAAASSSAAAANGANTALVPVSAAASSAAAGSGAGAAESKQKRRKEKEAKLLPAMPSADDLQNALAIAREMAAEALSGPGEANAVDLKVHPSGIVPTLQNIVATVSLGLKLNLKDIAMRARNAEYNPKRFSAVIMRIREPKTTALVFTTGKMVVTGAKSELQARLAARKYARIIQKLGFPEVKFLGFKIENLVGSCDVKFPIRLEGLAQAHDEFSSYEPELFPGLIYRMVAPKIVLLIFVSGKVVLTGAKSREQIYEAFENIYPVLTEFRKEAHDDAAAAAGMRDG